MGGPTFASLWEAVSAALSRERGLIVPIAAAFLFLPQLVLARWMGDIEVNQWFSSGNALRTLAVFVPVAIASLVGQLALSTILLGAGAGRTVGETLGASAGRVLPAMAANLIQALGFGFGLLLLIVPGFYMLGRLSLVIPLIVSETRDPLEAVRRSWDLTRGRGLQVMGWLALLFLGFLLLSIAVGGLAVAFGVVSTMAGAGAAEGWGVGRWLVELVNAAASAAMTLLLIAFIAELYRQLRAAPAPGA
jgi:hypothetical protein